MQSGQEAFMGSGVWVMTHIRGLFDQNQTQKPDRMKLKAKTKTDAIRRGVDELAHQVSAPAQPEPN